MMPKRITTTGYPCPILFVHGFEGINFGNYVLVRIPHPCPSRYPVGEINLMCLKQNQWSNITTQTDHVSVEQQYYIDLHVQHFSGYVYYNYMVLYSVGEVGGLAYKSLKLGVRGEARLTPPPPPLLCRLCHCRTLSHLFHVWCNEN